MNSKPSTLLATLLAGLCLLTLPAWGQDTSPSAGQKVTFLGGQLTFWASRWPGSYIQLVDLTMQKIGKKIEVVQAGGYEDNSKNALARLGSVVSQKTPWLVFESEANDVRARDASVDDVKKTLGAIVDQVTAAGIKMVILTYPMEGDDPNSPTNQKIAPYNEAIRALAKAKNLELADVFAEMQADAVKMKADYPYVTGALLSDSDGGVTGFGQMAIASSILKAWGVTDAQLADIRPSWMDIPGAIKIPINASFSVQEYINLCPQASAKQQSIRDFLGDAGSKSLQDFLTAHGGSSTNP